MEFVCTKRDNFLQPLQIVHGIVERKVNQPILSNIVIRKEGKDIVLVSSDGEMQIVTQAPIGRGSEDAATTVAARKLAEIIRSLPESGEIRLTLSDKRLTVLSGKSRYTLQVLPAEDFPTLQEPDVFEASVQMPQKVLRRLIDLVHFAMAQLDVRYYLNGMCLQLAGDRVIAVATDGHRLAYAHADGGESYGERQVILPAKVVMELRRQLESCEDPVTLSFAAGQLRCEFGSTQFCSKLIEGKFPDYTRVIPKDYEHAFIAGRAELLRSLQRAALLADDKTRAVRCVFEQGVLRVTATNTVQEEAVEELDIPYAGPTVEIGLNVGYMMGVLDNLSDDSVSIALRDAGSPLLVTVPGRDDFTFVCMPVKL